jgi:hypothetical protein
LELTLLYREKMGFLTGLIAELQANEWFRT